MNVNVVMFYLVERKFFNIKYITIFNNTVITVILKKKNAYIISQPKQKIIDDNDEAAIDAETMKQRKWDDFKDDNPKGWGNRMNKG